MKKSVITKILSVSLAIIFAFAAMNVTFVPPVTVSAATSINYFRGINFAGAGFSSGTFWTGQDHINYYAGKGFDIFRISIKWERIQPQLNGPLDAAYLSGLKTQIDGLNSVGKKAIIDVHNYGRYEGNVIGDSSVTTAHFTDLWTKISSEFKDNPAVYGYDLMNEPHDMGSADWKDISQAVVTAIRSNGDDTLIMVEGNAWASAYQWEANNVSPSGWITDPANNFLYSAHIYFDYDRTGTYKKTYDEELALNPDLEMVGADRVRDFLVWCSKNNVRGYIGEFGVPRNDIRWNTVLDNFMAALDEYGMDATYWSGGAGWPDSYNLNCNPLNGADSQQMSVLTSHLSGSIGSIPAPPAGILEAEDLAVNAISGTHASTYHKTASGSAFDLFSATAAGDYIEYKANVPAAGTYQVKVKVNNFINNGKYQLSIDGTNLGYEFDSYFFTVDDDKIFDLGYVTFAEGGEKLIRLTCTGKNASSQGFLLPLDYIQLAPFSGEIPPPKPAPVPDTEAPSAPGSLSLNPASINQVDLQWNSSTDNIGVIGYIVYRNGMEIGRTLTNTFSDRQVEPSVTQEYTVKAYDRYNLSAPSNAASIITENTAPSFLPVADLSQIQYTVSKQNVGGKITSKAALDPETGKITLSMDISQAWIAHEQHPFFYYLPLYNNGAVAVRLTDADMAYYAGVMVAEKVTDTAPRFLMTGLTTDAYNAAWGIFKVHSLARITEGDGIVKNRSDSSSDTIFKNVSVPFWAKIVRTGESISSYIKNSDGSWGNGKGASTPLRTVVLAGLSDNDPVYAGVGMSANAAVKSTKGSKWSAEFDSLTLQNYPIPGMQGEPVSFPVRTADKDQQPVTVSITENQLPADADYSLENGQFTWNNTKAGQYKITFTANDGIADSEPMSVILNIKQPDTVAPSAPADLTVTPVSYNQIDLKWTASTDNNAVSGYVIYRDGVEAGRSDTNSFSDTGLQFSTAYSYTVKAFDKAQNLSEESEAASAITESLPLSFLPIVDFASVQYTVSASTATGTIGSQASVNPENGRITLSIDVSRATKVHEQHPFFYYVPLYGNAEVIARLTDADMANYAGLMVAERVTDDAPRLLMTGLTTDGYNPTYGPFKVHSMARTAEGAAPSKNRHESSSDLAYLAGKTTPFWVKIVRTGDQVSSYIQNANGAWGNGKGGSTPLRTVSFAGLPADAPVYAGVAMTALTGKGRNIWTAEFDNFEISNYTLPTVSSAPVSFPVRVASPMQNVSVTISGNDLPAGAIYALENGQFTWSNPIGGTYHITFAANDGYTAKTMNITLVISDKTAPVTTDDTDSLWHNAPQTVTLTATDESGAVASTCYQVNEGEWIVGNTITLSDEGIHTIRYYSTDNAGNVEEIKTAEVKIDLTGPVIDLETISPVYRTDTVLWPITVTDALSGAAEVSAKLDGEAVTPDAISIEPFELACGTHTIEVKAKDNAGNETVQAYEFEVTMDLDHLDEAIQIGLDKGWVKLEGILKSFLAQIKNLLKLPFAEKLIANRLNALENHILAQSGKFIDQEFAEKLIEDIRYLMELYRH